MDANQGAKARDVEYYWHSAQCQGQYDRDEAFRKIVDGLAEIMVRGDYCSAVTRVAELQAITRIREGEYEST